MGETAGREMYRFAGELFPICRSLTGDGVRRTLRLIRAKLPGLKIHEVPSGTKCFDWTVPPEWNIRDAFVADASGRRVIDFKAHNLHVVGYSEPVDRTMSLRELEPHLHSLPRQPEAIPYVTTYYKRGWGFCLPHRARGRLKQGTYRVRIDSTLAPGSLSYGELVIPGRSREEVFLSTYVCHPSMANNEVSGPVVAAFLGRWLSSLKARRYTYRLYFGPETIGALAYLRKNLDVLKRRVVAGFVLTCVGDDRGWSFLPSPRGDTRADDAALAVLERRVPGFKRYGWLDRASDERQWCSPGVDLPMVSVMRSKYHVYPEYHTSLDDMSVISANGLGGSLSVLQECLSALEADRVYAAACLGEPQLGRRGLYHHLSTKGAVTGPQTLLDLFSCCDGKRGLLGVARLMGCGVADLAVPLAVLLENGLVREVRPQLRRR